MAEILAQKHRQDKKSRIKNARVEKRPLLRPQLPSGYAGKKHEKVVYIGSKTPFISAVKRVRKLLQQAERRATQGKLDLSDDERTTRRKGTEHQKAKGEAEEILLRATGKAIEKAMNLALFFKQQEDCIVKIRTGSIDAIDDIVPLPGLPIHENYISNGRTEATDTGDLGEETRPNEFGAEIAQVGNEIEDNVIVPPDNANARRDAKEQDSKDPRSQGVRRSEIENIPDTQIRTTGMLELAVSLRDKVTAWNSFKLDDEDRDVDAEHMENLNDGQAHRSTRFALQKTHLHDA